MYELQRRKQAMLSLYDNRYNDSENKRREKYLHYMFFYFTVCFISLVNILLITLDYAITEWRLSMSSDKHAYFVLKYICI